jgi:hypothetical protein
MMLGLALERLAEQIPDPFEVEMARLIAEKLGDGIRLGIGLDARLRSWLKNLSSSELDQILERAAASLEQCPLPTRRDDDVTLELAAGTRDRVESTSIAVHRSCVAKGVSPISALPTWGAFLDEMAQFDGALKACASRTEIESALGERRALLRESDWTATFETSTGEPDQDSAGFDLEGLKLPAGASPPDSVVASYVGNGEYAVWVEGFAQKDRPFADELASVIESFRQMREPIGLVARRWEARHEKGTEMVSLPLDLAQAADTGDAESESRIPLGVLAPLGCSALLVETRERFEVLVAAGQESIAVVEFGPSRVETADATGAWRVSIERTHEPVILRVVARDGREFKATLHPVPPTSG